MGLNDFDSDIDYSEWWWTSSEVNEVSEKFKEWVKKTAKKAKRVRKDEWKAKKYDFMLAKFLVKLILNKKYDDLLSSLFLCLDKWYWTNFLLWILSLVYMPISDEIRKNLWKSYVSFNHEISPERKEFDWDEIDEDIKARINYWVEDIEFVLFIESSEIVTQKTIDLLKEDDSIIVFAGKVFRFFFNEINIEISVGKSESYARFIIWELEKSLEKLKIED